MVNKRNDVIENESNEVMAENIIHDEQKETQQQQQQAN